MILRIVRGRVAIDRVEGLTAALGATPDGHVRATPGLVRSHVGLRGLEGDEREVVLVTCWETVDAAVAEEAGTGGVAFFEVDESTLRRSDAAAHVLRLSVGRVARGMDVDIQGVLRERMHLLGSEMTEGYVGRRILGNDVEIAFISAWDREPEGRTLDGPIWPDISAGYDAFEVATFRPLVSEAAAR